MDADTRLDAMPHVAALAGGAVHRDARVVHTGASRGAGLSVEASAFDATGHARAAIAQLFGRAQHVAFVGHAVAIVVDAVAALGRSRCIGSAHRHAAATLGDALRARAHHARGARRTLPGARQLTVTDAEA